MHASGCLLTPHLLRYHFFPRTQRHNLTSEACSYNGFRNDLHRPNFLQQVITVNFAAHQILLHARLYMRRLQRGTMYLPTCGHVSRSGESLPITQNVCAMAMRLDSNTGVAHHLISTLPETFVGPAGASPHNGLALHASFCPPRFALQVNKLSNIILRTQMSGLWQTHRCSRSYLNLAVVNPPDAYSQR